MERNDYTATVFLYPDGRMGVVGDTIRGLILEVDTYEEMRSELLRLVPILLRANHGRNDEEIASATLRLSFQKAPPEDTELTHHSSHFRQTRGPILLWEDNPYVPAGAYL